MGKLQFLINIENWGFEAKGVKAGAKVTLKSGSLHLHLIIDEPQVLANVKQDQGEIWTDSCAEFFWQVDSLGYYNLEVNPMGKCYFAFGQTRNGRMLASEETLLKIERNTSWNKNDDTRPHWEVELLLPPTVMFAHSGLEWKTCQIAGNFYKCGDNLQAPHFLSWQKVDVPTPSFHQPQFFKEIRL